LGLDGGSDGRMSGSSDESANLQLPCELELANKGIFQVESLLIIRGD